MRKSGGELEGDRVMKKNEVISTSATGINPYLKIQMLIFSGTMENSEK